MTSSRKQDHIRICLERDVEFKKKNGFERYEFDHRALPEINFSDISTSTTFLGRKLAFPLFIEPLTGGAPGTEKINRNLARAAEALCIGMGLGSQRAMLEDHTLTYTYQIRDVAPSILLLGNIGAAQLSDFHFRAIVAMIKEIGADGLMIHLNAAQELCQPEGNTDWRNVLSNIEKICKKADFAVIVKETGCGMPVMLPRCWNRQV